MKTVRMVANRAMYYNEDRSVGEEFEVREDHVQPLARAGSASVVDKSTKTTKPYNRRDMRAEK